ncbi:hypothetical protein ZHAS_00012767 [Anopheles sinensis]|uniref:Uncharacterized protein n=1 Tax=Anopheles sinensis TaxID=74873 RepID=A0A084W3R4_ANOSI|nr:hypothetical protein ZHAS_00012767 [Anopheles sinensis]
MATRFYSWDGAPCVAVSDKKMYVYRRGKTRGSADSESVQAVLQVGTMLEQGRQPTAHPPVGKVDETSASLEPQRSKQAAAAAAGQAGQAAAAATRTAIATNPREHTTRPTVGARRCESKRERKSASIILLPPLVGGPRLPCVPSRSLASRSRASRSLLHTATTHTLPCGDLFLAPVASDHIING